MRNTVTGGTKVKEGAREYGEDVHKAKCVDVNAIRHVMRWMGPGDVTGQPRESDAEVMERVCAYTNRMRKHLGRVK